MKFKRFLQVTPVVALALVAAGCDKGSKELEMTYTNADGEVVEVSIAATKDAEKVADALTAIYENAQTETEFNAATIKISADLDLEANGEAMDISGTAEFAGKLPNYTDDTTVMELFSGSNLYADLDLDFNVALGEELGEYEGAIDVQLYSDTDNYYVNIADLSGFEEMGMPSVVGKYKFGKEMLIGMLESELDEETAAMLNSTMGDIMSSVTVPEEMPSLDDMLAESGMTLEQIVEMLGIEITKVKGDVVTFKINMAGAAAQEAGIEADLPLLISLNTKNMTVTNIKLNATDYVDDYAKEVAEDGKCDSCVFEIEISYTADIPTVKDADKYTSIEDMMSGMGGEIATIA
ncbi:MAG: hypothetical protein IJA65_00735 [Acholeplasmatales bacterium]|nr:hypothetical protein [Acholeplasmatales bacterium]